MISKYFTVTAFIISMLFVPLFLGAWEPYDRVVATVNEGAVIQSDVDAKFELLSRTKKIPASRVSYEKSRILDEFIENALVSQSAEESAIIVTDKKVLSRLENLMTGYLDPKLKDSDKKEEIMEKYRKQLLEKVQADRAFEKGPKLDNNLQDFVNYVQHSQNQPFTVFFDELKSQILKQDFLSLSLGVSPPSEQEVRNWFNANRSRLGQELLVKHILIIPKGNSFAAEREAADKLSSIRKQILAGESFEKMAIAWSQDPGSASKGGDLGWIMAAEMDPYFAGNVFSSYSYGAVTKVFKSSYGYHIAKFYGRRAVTLDKVYPMISQKLYYEKITDQYKKWAAKKKSESEIKIYMENYVKG